MFDLSVYARVAEFVAAISAMVLWRRRPEHRPAAVALAVFTAADTVRAFTDPALRPWNGNRALFHVDVALALALQAVLPTLALVVCVEHKRRAIGAMVAVWALVSTGCAVLYPSPLVYGEGLARIYLACDLIGLFISIVVFVRWVRERKALTSSHVVLLLFAAGDVSILLAPYSAWRGGIFNSYETAQFALLLVFLAMAIYQGVVLWRSTARSS
jgi:hypothetical protein